MDPTTLLLNGIYFIFISLQLHHRWSESHLVVETLRKRLTQGSECYTQAQEEKNAIKYNKTLRETIKIERAVHAMSSNSCYRISIPLLSSLPQILLSTSNSHGDILGPIGPLRGNLLLSRHHGGLRPARRFGRLHSKG